jgi:hypothetical protein
MNQDRLARIPMSEVPAGSRNRCYRLRLPGACQDAPLRAERYLTGQAEAFDSYQRLRAEPPTGRVPHPLAAHEAPRAGAVGVDPL